MPVYITNVLATHTMQLRTCAAMNASCKSFEQLGLCTVLVLTTGQRDVATLAIICAVCAGDKAALDMVSLDCEMCSTAQGLELTRASLVDSNGQVMMFLARLSLAPAFHIACCVAAAASCHLHHIWLLRKV